ncbi:fumarylacetoacetate hydrolase family protein [Streptomyces resistomycificus]|uniref:2-hydroxyhepta-2,4-diene-1,7-dioate isomerase n=1 Tax=Streptomyces resistomycificus TaxID=67356 RepID=A0A0L8KRG6_9ACTN|nr:fumarylacetoacetate hydrolase family protein [Streptomyces resistomycificus]KOG28533.1 2-hydroxyhepta-2,4-diene-1,7-dioate isomerase [Streptomyces resistomycificus]KUN91182.1 2-hydroxyhepta-2,4-diene-1,7-dioate isomerase [Streptomyces resistomycificus]
MRIVRYQETESGEVSYGVLGADELITPLDGDPYGERRAFDRPARPLAEVTLLAPVEPSKVIAVGRNFAAHAAELGNQVPERPLIFLKPSTSVVGPGARIVFPEYTDELHHEAELAAVIGVRCRDLKPDEVPGVLLGYTCANDVTARDLQKPDGQWWRAKGSDTFCPLGPWVETELDPAGLRITATVNGELRQEGGTHQMVRPVNELIAHISAAMTLLPGDVVLTGTPAGVSRMSPGDTVTIAVEGVGELTNTVVRAI